MSMLSRAPLALSLALITGLAALAPASSHARPAATAPAQAAPLAVQPYHPGDDALFAVSSTLITGRHDAILVDAQFAATDAAQLVQRGDRGLAQGIVTAWQVGLGHRDAQLAGLVQLGQAEGVEVARKQPFATLGTTHYVDLGQLREHLLHE